jgi:carboxyl-terminal processing protease
MLSVVGHERIARGDGCVGVVRFNSWMPALAAAFDGAMDELRECAGLVVDLRGNLGGVAAMVMGISGYFLTEELALGVMRTRKGELRFVSNPRHVNMRGEPIEPYAGPLAILVDGHSASTSEFFAAGLQHVGRARVFGEPTAGEALPAHAMRLPTGDVLIHVIADFALPSGRRLEGGGVVPDERIPSTRATLLTGRDAPLDAALRWIASRTSGVAGRR